MDIIIVPLIRILHMALSLYQWLLIIYVIMSWLEQFNIINNQNQFVYTISNALFRLNEPILGRIRRILPAIGGVDLSPLVALLVIVFIQTMLERIMLKLPF